MLNKMFNRSCCTWHDGRGETTITGQEITGDVLASVEKFLLHESYPLRFHLEGLQRQVIEHLMYLNPFDHSNGKRRPDFSYVIGAAGRLRDEMNAVVNDFVDAVQLHEEVTTVTGPEANAAGPAYPAYRSSQQRRWAIDQDPHPLFECLYDTSTLLDKISPWSWQDACGILALWCIDETLVYVNSDEPYKAAAWALHSQMYADWQNSDPDSSGSASSAHRSSGAAFSEQGLAVRHAKNRSIKKEALSIYDAKQWRSQAEAARKISSLVNRTEKVVEKWLREHRKATANF